MENTMKFVLRRYSKVHVKTDFYPTSRVKIYRKSKSHLKDDSNTPKTTDNGHPKSNGNQIESIENEVKVQMISRKLHKQIFGNFINQRSNLRFMSERDCLAELHKAGINIQSTEHIPQVELKLPPLKGGNIEAHFAEIAKEQIAPYLNLLLPLVTCKKLPSRPKIWSTQQGWTMYDSKTGEAISVECPKDDGLVFDVEVCVREGGLPTLATAVSPSHWYSWIGTQSTNNTGTLSSPLSPHYRLEDLIPMGMRGPKIIIGHNVSYDRARLREQYLLEDTGTRFIDTMSLHMCVSGITSYQRALLKSKKEPAPEDTEWQAQSSLNSLAEVHRLYCGGATLLKEPRNIFLEGSLEDIKRELQPLMDYCASDVEATHRVLQVLYPLFAERFPHPATLAGMLELSAAYLPVNSNWTRFINESDLAYQDLSIEAKYHLSRRADEACSLLNEEAYRNHLWLWNEDWSVQQLKMKQPKTVKKSSVSQKKLITKDQSEISEELRLRQKFQYLYDTKSLLPARRPLLPGYPGWYRKLCKKYPKDVKELGGGEDWSPGATEISTGMQIAPKLLCLCWEGFPLFYLKDYGWGFLVPFRKEHPEAGTHQTRIPLKQLVQRCPVLDFDRHGATEAETDYAFHQLNHDLDAKLGKREFYEKPKKDHTSGQYTGSGIWCNQILENSCYFFKLPHKNGKSFRVGNPLSRDFLNKFSENVLSSGDIESSSAARIIEIARMMSYWRNNRDRILGQMVVWLPTDYIKERFQSNDHMEFGAICPQVVVCGTLTRRAMEPTWMTASNSKIERIGSELRSMVQAPPNYKIVGADVDSQELWIASLLGDAYACGIHGGTPLGWMTLSGTKANGTDMHSVTAKAVGISRDHAKVINYARIYGAGQNFAEGLLKQFNPTFSSAEAKSKAMKMFAITKGKKTFKIQSEFLDEYEDRDYTSYEAMKIALSCNRPISEMFAGPKWKGGTESAMFNRLEEIATGEAPVTPFLGCRLSRALELSSGTDDNRFLPTRINWVVQSGAVDFLHLMLVAMRWLMGPHVRFCLSFHDELRYLVKEEMEYKAALAMHVTNLLTRSFCSSRVGLSDLPMSVAFFSSVEVDKVLRKESTMDCRTPSNPHGLKIGYGIPAGESLNIYDAIKKAKTNNLCQWKWIK